MGHLAQLDRQTDNFICAAPGHIHILNVGLDIVQETRATCILHGKLQGVHYLSAISTQMFTKQVNPECLHIRPFRDQTCVRPTYRCFRINHLL